MIFDKLLVAAVCSWLGVMGLLPTIVEPIKPLNPTQLQVKAKEKSISNMCDRKPKSKVAKDLCRRWKKHNG